MSPIGIFGGTFDPIHYGHLRTAFEILQALRFGELRFVPSGDPPHRGKTYAPASLRLDMVRAATANEPRFIVDDSEVQRQGPSYTVDTLALMRQEQPDAPMGLILGMDAFLGLTDWHRWDEILDYAHIVVAHRPGWRAPDIGAIGELITEHGTHRIDDLHERRDNLIYIHAVTQLEISSTEIRDLVGAGRDPRFLMPDVVRNVINESNCYQEN
jgi:nicotinate-nucleotide adenylyltransferase